MGWNEAIKKELGSVGEQVFIGENVIFTNPKEVHLGDRVRIDPFTLITTKLRVYSNVQICSHAVLGGGSKQTITLADWTFIGYGTQLFTASEDYSGQYGPVNEFWGSNRIFRGDIKLEMYSGVASQSILMPGTILPAGCTIGAQSFVYDSKDLQPWSIYLGNPLRYHKPRDTVKMMEAIMDPDFKKDR